MKKYISTEKQAPLLVVLLLLMSAVFIYRRFIFGDELWVFVGLDIGSDTVQQYLPGIWSISRSPRSYWPDWSSTATCPAFLFQKKQNASPPISTASTAS